MKRTFQTTERCSLIHFLFLMALTLAFVRYLEDFICVDVYKKHAHTVTSGPRISETGGGTHFCRNFWM